MSFSLFYRSLLSAFLSIFLLAQIVGMFSNPRCLGVFETMILTLLGLSYLFTRYLDPFWSIGQYTTFFPLVIATMLLGIPNSFSGKEKSKSCLLLGQWIPVYRRTCSPCHFCLGALSLSGAVPAVNWHISLGIEDLIPLPVIEISHFLAKPCGGLGSFFLPGPPTETRRSLPSHSIAPWSGNHLCSVQWV